MRPTVGRLLRAAPLARGALLLLALAGVGQGVAAVAAAFAVAALLVGVVSGTDLRGPVLGVVGVFGGRALLAYAVERMAASAAGLVSTSLRHRLLAGWLSRPVDRVPEPAVGTTLAAHGTAAVETYVTRYLPAVVQATVLPALAVTVLVLVDWPSALVVAATLPLLPLFAALVGRTTQQATQQRWRRQQDLAGHFLDVVRGLPTLVAYGRGMRQVASIRTVSEGLRTETMATLRLSFLSSAALELLATLSVALVAVTVGMRLASGGLDLHTGLVAILLAPEAYWPIRRVGTEYHAAADGAQALTEILAELQQPAGEPGAARASGIRLDGVSYRYPGTAVDALHPVSVRADRGLVVVTGPSGAGKTTLLEVIAGLREPTGGRVSSARAHLVTQRPFLVPGSVRTNLTVGQRGQGDAVDLWRVLRRVGLDGVVSQLPGGLGAVLGDDGFGLSAGQRARLALARALLSDAPVLLLDEPTAHLDPAGAEQVHALLRSVAQHRTVVAVTHRPQLLALADQHVCLDARVPVR